VPETNNIKDVGIDHHATRAIAPHITELDPSRGDKLIRIRLLTDRDFPAWDVSYVLGQFNGEQVHVRGMEHQLPKSQPVKALIRRTQLLTGVDITKLVPGGYVNDIVSRAW
jgi:hypothetical protein